eukprot:TRINITY_DN184_c6_g1_i1.p1 TRINITY_DN184_c6_g1~~TRINITY_DN184_c6_g1_i1.p1  ORF type:complete len:2054 (+),score=489.11 TRINITY_DN184_c6_g1_i1:319-6162(+)
MEFRDNNIFMAIVPNSIVENVVEADTIIWCVCNATLDSQCQNLTSGTTSIKDALIQTVSPEFIDHTGQTLVTASPPSGQSVNGLWVNFQSVSHGYLCSMRLDVNGTSNCYVTPSDEADVYYAYAEDASYNPVQHGSIRVNFTDSYVVTVEQSSRYATGQDIWISGSASPALSPFSISVFSETNLLDTIKKCDAGMFETTNVTWNEEFERFGVKILKDSLPTSGSIAVCICDLSASGCYLSHFWTQIQTASITGITLDAPANHSHFLFVHAIPIMENPNLTWKFIGVYSNKILADTTEIFDNTSVLQVNVDAPTDLYCAYISGSTQHGEACFMYTRTSNVSLFLPFKYAGENELHVVGAKSSEPIVDALGFVMESGLGSMEPCNELSPSTTSRVVDLVWNVSAIDVVFEAGMVPKSGHLHWCACNKQNNLCWEIPGLTTEITNQTIAQIYPNEEQLHGGYYLGSLTLSSGSGSLSGKYASWKSLGDWTFLNWAFGEIDNEEKFLVDTAVEFYPLKTYVLSIADSPVDLESMVVYGNITQDRQVEFAFIDKIYPDEVWNGAVTLLKGSLSTVVSMDPIKDAFRVGYVTDDPKSCYFLDTATADLQSPTWIDASHYEVTFPGFSVPKDGIVRHWCHCNVSSTCFYSGLKTTYIYTPLESVSPSVISHRGTTLLTITPKPGIDLLDRCFVIYSEEDGTYVSMSPLDSQNQAITSATSQTKCGSGKCQLRLLDSCGDAASSPSHLLIHNITMSVSPYPLLEFDNMYQIAQGSVAFFQAIWDTQSTAEEKSGWSLGLVTSSMEACLEYSSDNITHSIPGSSAVDIRFAFSGMGLLEANRIVYWCVKEDASGEVFSPGWKTNVTDALVSGLNPATWNHLERLPFSATLTSGVMDLASLNGKSVSVLSLDDNTTEVSGSFTSDQISVIPFDNPVHGVFAIESVVYPELHVTVQSSFSINVSSPSRLSQFPAIFIAKWTMGQVNRTSVLLASTPDDNGCQMMTPDPTKMALLNEHGVAELPSSGFNTAVGATFHTCICVIGEPLCYDKQVGSSYEPDGTVVAQLASSVEPSTWNMTLSNIFRLKPYNGVQLSGRTASVMNVIDGSVFATVAIGNDETFELPNLLNLDAEYYLEIDDIQHANVRIKAVRVEVNALVPQKAAVNHDIFVRISPNPGIVDSSVLESTYVGFVVNDANGCSGKKKDDIHGQSAYYYLKSVGSVAAYVKFVSNVLPSAPGSSITWCECSINGCVDTSLGSTEISANLVSSFSPVSPVTKTSVLDLIPATGQTISGQSVALTDLKVASTASQISGAHNSSPILMEGVDFALSSVWLVVNGVFHGNFTVQLPQVEPVLVAPFSSSVARKQNLYVSGTYGSNVAPQIGFGIASSYEMCGDIISDSNDPKKGETVWVQLANHTNMMTFSARMDANAISSSSFVFCACYDGVTPKTCHAMNTQSYGLVNPIVTSVVPTVVPALTAVSVKVSMNASYQGQPVTCTSIEGTGFSFDSVLGSSTMSVNVPRIGYQYLCRVSGIDHGAMLFSSFEQSGKEICDGDECFEEFQDESYPYGGEKDVIYPSETQTGSTQRVELTLASSEGTKTTKTGQNKVSKKAVNFGLLKEHTVPFLDIMKRFPVIASSKSVTKNRQYTPSGDELYERSSFNMFDSMIFVESVLEFDDNEIPSTMQNVDVYSLDHSLVGWKNASLKRNVDESDQFGSFTATTSTSSLAKGSVEVSSNFRSVERDGLEPGSGKFSLRVEDWAYVRRRLGFRFVVATRRFFYYDQKGENPTKNQESGSFYTFASDSVSNDECAFEFVTKLVDGTDLSMGTTPTLCDSELCKTLNSNSMRAVDLLFSVKKDNPALVEWDPKITSNVPNDPIEPSDPENDVPSDDGGGGGDDDDDDDKWLIVGIVLGTLILAVLCVIGSAVYFRRRRKKRALNINLGDSSAGEYLEMRETFLSDE